TLALGKQLFVHLALQVELHGFAQLVLLPFPTLDVGLGTVEVFDLFRLGVEFLLQGLELLRLLDLQFAFQRVFDGLPFFAQLTIHAFLSQLVFLPLLLLEGLALLAELVLLLRIAFALASQLPLVLLLDFLLQLVSQNILYADSRATARALYLAIVIHRCATRVVSSRNF